jgi:WD40 repeat protein
MAGLCESIKVARSLRSYWRKAMAKREKISQRLVATGVWWFIGLAQATAATLPPITAIAVTPDKAAVVVGSQSGVEVRSWPSLVRVAELPTELANVHDLAFSPDGKVLAVGGGHPAVEGGVELYRWPEKELIRRVNPHDDAVYAVSWRPDGKELTLASGDHRLSVVAVSTEPATRYLDGHSRAVLAVAHLPNGTGAVSGGVDQTIRVWQLSLGTTQRTLANHTRDVTDLEVRPSGGSQAIPEVASASEDRTVRFWQPTIGRLVRFARLESPPLALAWSHDGQVVWAACRDGRVRGVDPETTAVVKEVAAVDGVAYAIAIAPDENLLVGGSDGQLRRVAVKSP